MAKRLSLKEQVALYKKMAYTDHLTSLGNRRYFCDAFAETVEKRPSAVSLVVFDIDHFKSINDAYGHYAGDRVLAEVAALSSEAFKSDKLARWGGEEFVLLLKCCGDKAFTRIDEFRQKVESHTFSFGRKITISSGVSEMDKSDTFDSIMVRADNAMYVAKRNGRNRTERV